jgi:predicted outer membrane repeat protein
LNEAGCDQPYCEEQVCAQDPVCCTSDGTYPDTWLERCVVLAETLCGDLCTFNDDNLLHVVSAQNVDETAVLESFVVEGGRAGGPEFWDKHGGGLLVHGGRPTIRYCTFRRNFGGYGAAAHFVDAPGTSLELCRFLNNTAEAWAGAVYNRRSSPRFFFCYFNENFADLLGGAVVNQEDSFPFFEQCSFWSNRTGPTGYGGAMINTEHSRSDVKDGFFGVNESRFGGAVANYAYHNNGGRFVQCAFIANNATDSGGAIFGYGDLDLIDCLVVYNTALYGAAVFHDNRDGSVLRVINSTFVGNRADADGGGIYHWSSVPLQLHNSILWANSAQPGAFPQSAQLLPGDAAPEVMYTAIQGWTGSLGGVGNTGVDPQFRDPIGLDGMPFNGDEDLRLHPESPYVEAGSNELLPPDDLDLDEDGDLTEPLPLDLQDQTRVRDGDGDAAARVDLGAYEYQATPLGDADHDDDIDLDDLTYYVRQCLRGPALPLVGDFDASHQVNLVDFAMWYACADGPGIAPIQGCEYADLHTDGAVDLRDFAEWSRHVGERSWVSVWCEPTDMDLDRDVDLEDVSRWISVFGTQ